MRLNFAGPWELSSTHVNHLWMGVIFVMTHRAARALEWAVPEVELACRQQLADLTAYRASVAAVIARVSSAYSGGDVARSVNRTYLLFFLPFWWEHVLLRGALAPDVLEKEAKALLHPVPPEPLRGHRRQPVQALPLLLSGLPDCDVLWVCARDGEL
jgi:hypothetical protein